MAQNFLLLNSGKTEILVVSQNPEIYFETQIKNIHLSNIAKILKMPFVDDAEKLHPDCGLLEYPLVRMCKCLLKAPTACSKCSCSYSNLKKTL